MNTAHSPLISFIVPCYNYARFLPDCLNSILGQEGNFDFEVIVIDDASTDDTAEVIRKFTGDPRIRVITHATNLGHAGTINEGLMKARGEYIARIDPDDRYCPDFLSHVMEKFYAFPGVGLVYGDVAIIDDGGRIMAERCDRVHGGRDFKGNELVRLLERNFICAPSVIARRAAWLKAWPAPDGLAFNDWYFTLMMAREHEFYYIDKVLADYRVHNSNHHSNIVLNKIEEPSIFWLLDGIFSEQEKTSELEREKQHARRRIYGAQYLNIADKYFGCGYDMDARRCYLMALRYQPTSRLNASLLRRLIATYIGRKAYESLKLSIKIVSAPLARVRR